MRLLVADGAAAAARQAEGWTFVAIGSGHHLARDRRHVCPARART